MKVVGMMRVMFDWLEESSPWFSLLLIRLLLAWEFFEAGLTKLGGENWFVHIQDDFLWPFSIIPATVNWHLATWFELIGGVLLAIGLGTRFTAMSLLVLTIVATHAVHLPDVWPGIEQVWNGYAISDDGYGNFKLPLLFIAMLIPLIMTGPNKLSLDYLIDRQMKKD